MYGVAVVTLCSVFIGCAVEQGKVYEKDGKRYGVTDGLFKAKWDDYYLRGLSYSEGGFWTDAVEDFTKALSTRDNDQRRARTYGLHFIDYFPNRELGVAYFNLGRFQEALQFLETSLSQVETARAKFYLNKTRGSWLKETKLDTIPPTVEIQFPPPLYRTNDFAISVQGKAHDDFFVSTVILNGRPSPLELSRKEISFREECSLHHGKNVIVLQSEDILGKASKPVTIQVEVDQEGPLVFLEVREGTGGTLEITGAVYDSSTVAKLLLDGKELPLKGSPLIMINETLSRYRLPENAPIPLVAEDLLGNKTTAQLMRTSATNSAQMSRYPLLACAHSDSSLPHLALAEKVYTVPKSSEIDLKGLREGQTTFLDTLPVEGSVRAKEGIRNISFNGQSLLALNEDAAGASFLKLLREKKGIPLVFSKTIQLKEGENTIQVELADDAGNVSKKDIVLKKIFPKVKQISSRLSVAIVPFTEIKKTEKSLHDYVYTFLTNAFLEQKRFYMVGGAQLDKVLEQQKIGNDTAFNQQAAVRFGRLMGAETVLVGEITSTERSIEISARLIDTAITSLIVEKDVYGEGEPSAGFKDILDTLALKFKEHLPLCEGTVTQENAGTVTINLGSNQSLSPGMKFLAFRDTDPLIDQVTRMNLGNDTELRGLLSIRELNPGSSMAEVLKRFTPQGSLKGDKVISK